MCLVFVRVYAIVTEAVQQRPDCDMALVHDDDLAYIDSAVCSVFNHCAVPSLLVVSEYPRVP